MIFIPQPASSQPLRALSACCAVYLPKSNKLCRDFHRRRPAHPASASLGVPTQPVGTPGLPHPNGLLRPAPRHLLLRLLRQDFDDQDPACEASILVQYRARPLRHHDDESAAPRRLHLTKLWPAYVSSFNVSFNMQAHKSLSPHSKPNDR